MAQNPCLRCRWRYCKGFYSPRSSCLCIDHILGGHLVSIKILRTLSLCLNRCPKSIQTSSLTPFVNTHHQSLEMRPVSTSFSMISQRACRACSSTTALWQILELLQSYSFLSISYLLPHLIWKSIQNTDPALNLPRCWYCLLLVLDLAWQTLDWACEQRPAFY